MRTLIEVSFLIFSNVIRTHAIEFRRRILVGFVSPYSVTKHGI